MGLEIIHNQSYLFCLWVNFISYPFYKFCPICFCFVLSNFNQPFAL